MNTNNIKKLMVLILFPLAMVITSVQAQDAQEPILISVMQVQLKASGTDEFRSFHIEEVMPSIREQGQPWRLATSSVFGDSFEFVIASPITNYAQLDEGGFQISDMGAVAFENAVESRRRFVVQLRPELGIPGEQGVLSLRRMARFQVAQGKIQDFEEFWTETIIPSLRSAGVSGYQVFQTVMGGMQGEYFGTLYLPNFAALDSLNLGTVLSVREQAEFGELVAEFEVSLVSIDQELSYGLPNLQQ